METLAAVCCAPNRGARGRGDPTAPSTFSHQILHLPRFDFQRVGSWSGSRRGSGGSGGCRGVTGVIGRSPTQSMIRSARRCGCQKLMERDSDSDSLVRNRNQVGKFKEPPQHHQREEQCNLRNISPLIFGFKNTHTQKPLEGAKAHLLANFVITCLRRLIAASGGSSSSGIVRPTFRYLICLMALIWAPKLAAIKVLQGYLHLPRRKFG